MGFFRRGDEPTDVDADFEEIRSSIQRARLPDSVARSAQKELEKLEKIDPSVAEYAIGINYLEYLLSLPWDNFTEDNLDLDRAQKILDAYHYGLQSVKERILDYLAVRTLCSMQSFRVLVVDDEPIARANLEYVLKKEGYEVDTAENGAEAIGLLGKKNYDLVLTDLKMEKVDGIKLLEITREISPHTETVIFTGYATVSSAVDALRKGAVHYLSKPINLDELRKVVRDIKASKQHLQTTRGPMLCFAGPPGTGKTSVGKAIAEALGRQFVLISMAGLRDEAELRGHRRTYVGAMPGRILNEIKKCGVANPLFMLDEIDKIGQDFKGDPASVLLEILDPEQNSHFLDYYLDHPFDLSHVIFISTANNVDQLPGPLRDRLEVIEFFGYSEKEKLRIAQYHLIPRQLSSNGLTQDPPTFQDKAIVKIIREYTQESGVRNLEREIGAICRKLARKRLRDNNQSGKEEVDPALVERLLGPRKFRLEATEGTNRIGVATGLVWTDFGGEIIFVESSIMPGSQQLILTGSLGKILKESAQTALSLIRSRAEELGIPSDFYRDKDIHIHIPAGAIPKDGPSAGLTIAAALVSLLTQRPAKKDIAITGELSLTGRIIPISGVREKVLAAQRAGLSTVIFPRENLVDIDDLDKESTEGLKIITVNSLEETLEIALADKK